MASKMKQIHRIAKIIKVLKEKRLSAEEIKSICSETDEEVSIRQIQRDINDVSVFLDANFANSSIDLV